MSETALEVEERKKRAATLTYDDFIHHELIHFSMADNRRSIPSMVDGLKHGQRKVLFGSLKVSECLHVTVPPPFQLSIRRSICSFVDSSIHALIHLLIHPYLHSSVHSFIHPSIMRSSFLFVLHYHSPVSAPDSEICRRKSRSHSCPGMSASTLDTITEK